MNLTCQLVTRLAERVGRRPIVVVTDRYPPNSVGGAELSLHIVLSALERKHDILVATFDDALVVPRTYCVDGVTVLAIPRQARWPFQRHARSNLMTVEGLLAATKPKLFDRLQFLALARDTSLSIADRRLLERALATPRPKGGIPSDFAEYPGGLAVTVLRTLFAECKPCVVHADNYQSILVSALAARGLPIKLAGVVRDNRFHCVRHNQSLSVGGQFCTSCQLTCASEDLAPDPALQADLLARSRTFRVECLRALDRVVVTSRYLEEQIGAIVDPARVVRIPNAPDSYESVLPLLRGVAELPGTNLLIVGMINENKGQLQLVRQLDRLIARVPDVRIHFAGRGARLEARIREVAQAKRLQDRLVFHGYLDRSRLYQLYRECQIVVLPTVWPEPFGRVPLEAGTARRPVVAFSVGGLNESIVDGETGLLVPPGDYSALFIAIQTLAERPELRLRMGEAAFEHILQKYGTQQLAQRLASLWRELADGNAHRPPSFDTASVRAAPT